MVLVKNQQIQLKITGLTAQGSGVGHHEGMAVFVENTAVGDVILAHIIKVKKNYAIAKINKIINSSADRIAIDCEVFSQCGGCAYRHIDYAAECLVKQQRVRDAMQRIGHIDIEPKPIISAENTNGYRNKAQYPVSRDKGDIKIGFYATRSHRIVPCKTCFLQPEIFTSAVRAFEKWIRDCNITTYDETTHEGLLRHIYLRQATATGEVMACAVINGNQLPYSEYLVECLLEEIETLKSVVYNINCADTNVILGEKCVTVWGKDYIVDELCGLKFRISCLSFYQVNRMQAQKLYEKAAEYAGLDGSQTVLDLYCGAGTIGLSMAGQAKKIIGVEIIEQAVADAKVNAELNGIENAEFICSDAAQAAEIMHNEGIKPEVVIVDPPRKGCDTEIIETIVQMNPDRVVYVSCDPATLARDCELFEKKGYKVQNCTPVDLFPRTVHVETVVLMSRVDK